MISENHEKNTLASPIYEIKSNLGKIGHFVVKQIHASMIL